MTTTPTPLFEHPAALSRAERPRRQRTRRPTARFPMEQVLERLRTEVARWALAGGRPLRLEALSVVLAVRFDQAAEEVTPFHFWDVDSLRELLLEDVPSFCAHHRIAVPDGLEESTATYLRFLRARGSLAKDSAPLEMLLAELVAGAAPESRPVRGPSWR